MKKKLIIEKSCFLARQNLFFFKTLKIVFVFIALSIVNDTILNTTVQAANKLSQQQSTVTGKITDGNGDPLPGVTIVIKGTTQGTITDFDGIYSFSEVPNGAVLVATFIGMRSQEITINGRSTINFTMEEETIGLDEIVAVGYGVQKKSNITGAISSVKSSDIETTTTSSAGFVEGKHELFPYPLVELQSNSNLVQNSGW